MRALGRRHPGAFEAFHYGPAKGERAAAPIEAGFAAFRAAGFDARSTYAAVKAVTVSVLGHVLEDTVPVRSRAAARTDVAELPIERFPNAHALNRVAATTDTFGFLVESLIAGFEAMRKARRRRRAPRG